MNKYTTIGQKLVFLREQSGYKQFAVAKNAGIVPSVLCWLECSEELHGNLTTFCNLCSVYGVRLGFLIGDEEYVQYKTVKFDLDNLHDNLRTKRGETPRWKIAESAEIHINTIGRYENPSKRSLQNYNVKCFVPLCNALGVPLDEMVGTEMTKEVKDNENY